MDGDRNTTRVTFDSGPVRRGPRGSISRLPSGSLLVRVYAGLNPVTGREHYLCQTVPASPPAVADAEAACRRLLDRVGAAPCTAHRRDGQRAGRPPLAARLPRPRTHSQSRLPPIGGPPAGIRSSPPNCAPPSMTAPCHPALRCPPSSKSPLPTTSPPVLLTAPHRARPRTSHHGHPRPPRHHRQLQRVQQLSVDDDPGLGAPRHRARSPRQCPRSGSARPPHDRRSQPRVRTTAHSRPNRTDDNP